MNSILTSIKKLLGIIEEYEEFDVDIIIHINSVFMILRQLGVGPIEPFSISDKSAEWTDFIPADDPRFESVKSYVYMKCRQMFDPPTGAGAEAMNNLIQELEWRLNVEAETDTRKETSK